METWKSIPGFEDYEVSDHGNVRSLDKQVCARAGKTRTVKGKRLKAQLTTTGYQKVSLGRAKRNAKVHHLVLLAFVGPRPSGQWGLHGDGNPWNNKVSNLRWGTPADNSQDMVRHGRAGRTKGLASGRAVLTDNDIHFIRESSATTRNLGKQFEVSAATISKIRTRKLWAHVS